MKRLLAILLSVVVLFSLVGPINGVFAVVQDDVKISDISPDNIIENIGDSFTLTFRIENISGKKLENVKISVGNTSSFALGDSQKAIVNLGDIEAGGSIVLDDNTGIKLEYADTGKDFDFFLNYDKDGNPDGGKINIKVPVRAKDSSGSNNPGTGNTDLAPDIGIGSDAKMPVLKSGTVNKLSFPITNASRHAARDVNVTLNLGAYTEMFRIDDISLTRYFDNLDGQERVMAEYSLFVYSNAKSGVYPVTLHYKFKNVYGINQEYTENVNIKIENTSTPPSLILSKTELSPVAIVPGEDAKLILHVLNNGSLPAENIKINLQGLSSNGVALKDATDTKYVRYIFDHGIEKLEYDLAVSENLDAGIYEMTMQLEYEDSNKEKYTNSYKFYLPVDTKKLGKPSINIENLRFPTGNINKDQDFNIAFDLANYGADAKNIKIYASEGTGVITKSLSPFIIDTFTGGEKKTVKFVMSLNDPMGSDTIALPINVEYEDMSGGSQTLKKVIDIKVAKDLGEETVPKIIIEDYGFDPEQVKAGENFTLKIKFLNTNKSTPVSNIKISLSSTEGIFTPANSSNTFYVEEIEPGESVEREIVMFAKADAAPKSYPLNVDFEYEGGEFVQKSENESISQHIAKETISIPVVQVPRLVLGDIQLQPEAYVGQTSPVFLEFYNMGKSTLYNLMIKTEGDFDTQEASYFVGNFEPGRSDYYEGMVVPTTEGPVTGVIAFYFEDERGVETKVEEEFTINVMPMPNYEENYPGDMPGMGPDGMPLDEGAGKTNWILYIGIGAGILVAAAVVFIILRKRHIRKEGMTLDD